VLIAAGGVEHFKKEGCELIIVDTSGRHKQEASLLDEMEQVAKTIKPDDIVFVMDSSIGQAAQAQADAFQKKVEVGSVIMTKFDGHAKGGGALSAVAATGAPIIFLGTGEHFDDLEVFSAQSFVSRLLGFGDVEGLVDKIKSAGIDSQSDLYKRFTEGDFTLRDMYEHLQNVIKLGPMGKFMDMLPGLPQGMMKGKEKESTQHLKVFMTMMDSMTDFELDHGQVKKVMNPSRINRIARGSGRSVAEVNDLLKAYTKFEEMVKKVGKMRFKQMAKDPSAMMRGNQMAQLAKAIDPNVLKQMGGYGGLQNMMKQFSASGLDKML
jgi:signal recognition particle subunit SRP54